jgi:hypothetical protein
MTDLELYKQIYLNTLGRLPLLRLIAEALTIQSTDIDDILAEIQRLKGNQRLPDYSLGKYKDFCPHDRPLSDICPECYSSPNKFREWKDREMTHYGEVRDEIIHDSNGSEALRRWLWNGEKWVRWTDEDGAAVLSEMARRVAIWWEEYGALKSTYQAPGG